MNEIELNLYLNYYRHEVMQSDDNPPIGYLLENISEEDFKEYKEG